VGSRLLARAVLANTGDSNGFSVHRRATWFTNAPRSRRASRPSFDVAKLAAKNLADGRLRKRIVAIATACSSSTLAKRAVLPQPIAILLNQPLSTPSRHTTGWQVEFF
jgi:hypothetical protein